MKDQKKSKQELIRELEELRTRVAALESTEDEDELRGRGDAGEERFRSLVETTNDFIWELDRDNVFTYASPAIKDLLGYEPAEILGKTPFDLMASEEKERIRKLTEEITQSPKSAVAFDAVHVHKDGRRVVVEIRAVPVVDAAGKLQAVHGIGRDVTERRRIEEELRKERDTVDKIISLNPYSIGIFDKDGHILRWNQAFLDLCIVPPPREYSVFEDPLLKQSGFHEDMLQVKKGETCVVPEMWYNTRDVDPTAPDNSRCINVVNFPIMDANGDLDFVVVLTRDITKRKKAEKALQQSEQQYRAIVESVADSLFVIAMDGTIVEVNPAACETYGYSRDELIGLSAFKLIHPDHYGVVGELKKHTQLGGRYYGAGVDVRKDGSTFEKEFWGTTFHFRGQPHLLALIRDITDRKAAEATLRQKHEELQTIYDGTAEGLLIADAEAMQFRRANPSMCRMLRYTEDELLTMSVPDIHAPEEHIQIVETFRSIERGEIGSFDGIRFLRQDGTLFYADASAAAVTYKGRPCLLGFFRDVTERTLAEESLRKEQRHLQRLLDMHEQDRKLVAYEIHDGLAQSLIGAKMLLEAVTDGIKAHGSDHERTSYQRGLNLLGMAVEQARALMAGQRPLILDEHGLIAAIDYLVSDNQYDGTPEIEFTHDAEFGRLAAPLETAVFRIVQESLTNARRHSNSKTVRILVTQSETNIRLEIEDQGIGFDPDQVAEECFGLEGLRERARLFGGQATITAAPGRGTRIAVELPLVQE